MPKSQEVLTPIPEDLLRNLTAEKVAAWPDHFLAGALKFHVRAGRAVQFVDDLPFILAEARERGPGRIWCWWALQMLDPDRCACGGPGHYIVGKVTFCSKCRDKAIAANAPHRRAAFARTDQIGAVVREQDREKRKMDRLMAFTRSQRKNTQR